MHTWIHATWDLAVQMAANMVLSRELITANTPANTANSGRQPSNVRTTTNATFPRMNAATAAQQDAYWTAMRVGTGNGDYPIPDAHAPPSIFNYTQCVEVDSQVSSSTNEQCTARVLASASC